MIVNKLTKSSFSWKLYLLEINIHEMYMYAHIICIFSKLLSQDTGKYCEENQIREMSDKESYFR